MSDDLTAAQHGAQDRIHNLLTELADLIGPRFDDDDKGFPVEHAALAEWVIVAAWTDLDSGDSFTTRIGSPQLAEHHRTGLLHVALHDFDD